MSEDSLNDPVKFDRQRRRRRRASRNLDDGPSREAGKSSPSKGEHNSKIPFQDVSSKQNEKAQRQGKPGSSGNSNSLELNDDRRSRHRKSRKRETKDATESEEMGENSMERHRRPVKPRMNRSVSEEVLQIEREMNEGKHGSKPYMHGTIDGTMSKSKTENNSFKSSGHSRPKAKPKRNKTKDRLSRIQSASAEEENYQGDLDDEESFYNGFKVDKEDLVTEGSANSSKITAPLPKVNSKSVLPSEPLDVLFIEKKDGGFKKEQKSVVAQKMKMNYHTTSDDSPRVVTTCDFAVATQKAFKTFALFCHGLLAGVALCQCLFVYTLSSNNGAENFLSNYYKLAQPIGSMFYFMLAVCTVSVLDSYGLGRTRSGFCHKLLSNPLWTFTLIVYVLSLVFTLSVAMIDDKISLYKIHPSLWKNNEDKQSLDDWKIVNLMRVIGAVFGWMLLSWQPRGDASEVNLFDDDHVLSKPPIQAPSGDNGIPSARGFKKDIP